MPTSMKCTLNEAAASACFSFPIHTAADVMTITAASIHEIILRFIFFIPYFIMSINSSSVMIGMESSMAFLFLEEAEFLLLLIR